MCVVSGTIGMVVRENLVCLHGQVATELLDDLLGGMDSDEMALGAIHRIVLVYEPWNGCHIPWAQNIISQFPSFFPYT